MLTPESNPTPIPAPKRRYHPEARPPEGLTRRELADWWMARTELEAARRAGGVR